MMAETSPAGKYAETSFKIRFLAAPKKGQKLRLDHVKERWLIWQSIGGLASG